MEGTSRGENRAVEFVAGIELSRGFYDDVVAPIVGDRPHAAALLGYGSELVGFATERSTDHGWGPRLQVFLPDDAGEAAAGALRRALDDRLPESYGGWPVRFGWDEKPVEHHVEVTAVGTWFTNWIGFDPRAGVSTCDWLTTPQQKLLEVTRGAVFRDDLAELARVRAELAWYPHDVWLWLLACQWRRIDQEEPFVGRTAEVGDELGSRLLAARLAHDVMQLCFLMERTYASYSKWFGSAFARLAAAAEIGPLLGGALAANTIADREAGLVAAYEAVARQFNALGVTDAVEPTARRFHERPFLVIGAERFVAACLDRIADPELRHRPLIGSVDQWSDNTDLRSLPAVYREAGFSA